MAEASTVSSKFHQENSIFITATDEINASEVETYMRERILKGDFLANTKFVMVAGSHHGVNRNGEIVIGKTDYVLLQSFEHKVFSNLSKLKDKDGNNIWEEMNFDDELVTIACDEHLSFQPPFETTYELSERSQKKLTKLCDDLCNQTRPFCVFFASCYSYQSPIKDFMIEKGLLAAIDISKDRWEITGGRIFKFDKDQKEINDELTKDPTKSLFIIGSNGTGKTLALVAALKRKVSYYKRLKKPVKVLVLSHGENTNLLYDLKTRYGLQNILDEYHTAPKSLEQCNLYDSRYIFRSTSAFQNLSSLIADVNAKTYWQWLILLDEVTVGIGCQDFSSLHLYDNVEMVIAVNPTLSDEAFNIIPPKDKRFLFKRLRFKHRNSLEISVFLLHFKKKMNDPGVLYVSTFKQYVIQNTSIPDSEDTALVESALPAIDKEYVKKRNPVWIIANENLSQTEILQNIKDNHIMSEDRNVVLLYDSGMSHEVYDWCKLHDWTSIKYDEFRGCESSVTILYHVDYQHPEYYSRATNGLIIVHMYGEKYSTTPIFRQLSKHKELKNCQVCQEEEAKSKTLKFQGTSLIQRIILPKNECWICKLRFEDAEKQIKHFSRHHECNSCKDYFLDLEAKTKHGCAWKLNLNKNLTKDLEKTKSLEASDEDSEIQLSEQSSETSELEVLAKPSEDDSGRQKTDSLKGRVRNVLSSALTNIKRKLK